MKMKCKLMMSLAFSAAFLTAITTMPAARAEMSASAAEVVTIGPQADSHDASGAWSARQNVRNSALYDAMVRSNHSFQANRMRKECGPINDQQLHADCLASFSR